MSDAIIISVKDQVLRDLIIFSVQSQMYFRMIDAKDPIDLNIKLAKEENAVSVIYDDSFGVAGRKAVVEFMRDNDRQIPLYILEPNKIEIMVPGISEIHDVVKVDGDYLKVIMDGVKDYFVEDRTDVKREYVPITFRTLTRLRGLTEDVFIKLSEKKYLKIYRQDDRITTGDVEKYSKKGVDTLYLDKETSKWVLKELDKFVKQSFEKGSFDEEITLEPKTERVSVEETDNGVLTESQMKRIEDISDIDQEFMQDLGKRISHVKELAKKSSQLEKLIKAMEINRDTKNYYNAHNNILGTIVCLLARKMEWYQDTTLDKLVFAAQMHDLVLVEDPELAKINDPKIFENSKFALEDRQVALVEHHPIKMAELVKDLPVAPIDADKIIAQHHELPNRTGWPNQLSASRIIPLSALFIIGHDLVDYIIDNPDWTFGAYKKKVKTKFIGSHFKKIINNLD